MLQRAASNAYSWWWASHIRTKQSKWMEQNLLDMEEKVSYMLKLIEEDGDSFAKRAEMYYKRRPELISFVEETYKAYRALAERYDHISGELQSANNTIASVFPEQAQLAMDEEEYDSQRASTTRNPSKMPKGSGEVQRTNIPKAPLKDAKPLSKLSFKRVNSKKIKPSTATTSSKRNSSQMSKAEALDTIDRIQKGILALQTEKEFFKSSYESSHAKYWEIEQRITEMQEEVCSLQDEFSISTVIEDDEARKLIATTALKSCQETLVQLRERQEKSVEEARVEHQRIEDAHKQLETLKDKFLSSPRKRQTFPDKEESVAVDTNLKNSEQVCNMKQEIRELESIREKIREHFDMNCDTSLTVTELAEKIDELANKVISLETAVSSHTALIKRLRSETDELQAHLRSLEEDKATLIKGSKKLNKKLRKFDEELGGIRNLNQNVEDQINNLQTHFTEANYNLDDLSNKLQCAKPDEDEDEDEDIDIAGSLEAEEGILLNVEPDKEFKDREETPGDVSVSSEYKKSEVAEKIDAVQDFNVFVDGKEEDNGHSKAEKNFDNVSEDSQKLKQDGKEIEKQDSYQTEHSILNDGPHENATGQEKQQKLEGPDDIDQSKVSKNLYNLSEECQDLKQHGIKVEKQDSSQTEHSGGPQEQAMGQEKLRKLEGQDNIDQSKERKNHDNISEECQDPKQHVEKVEKRDSSQTEHSIPIAESQKQAMGQENLKKFDNLSEECQELQQTSSQTEDSIRNVEPQEEATEQEDPPNWKQLFLHGLEDREKILLTEYTSILRNYKEAKKKLSEEEKKNQDSLFGITMQLREIKSENAMKDEEIRSLRRKLRLLQTSPDENSNTSLIEFEDSHQGKSYEIMEEGSTFNVSNGPTVSLEQPDRYLSENQNVESEERIDRSPVIAAIPHPVVVEEEEIKVILVDKPQAVSNIEEKFRRDIDELLEENLDFWLRFSTSFHQIQKFQSTIHDLQAESSKLKEKRASEDSTTTESLKSDARSIYKHLREIQTELTVWLEQNALLRDELQYRFSSLCSIQDEISEAESETEDVEFTSYQAAKFQGEVKNMQQENFKVAEELKTGLDHVRGLQSELEKTLSKLNEEFKLSGSKNNQPMTPNSSDRAKVPLKSFIFGVKPKKQKQSIFSCMSPALHKQYNGLKSGFPM